MASIASTLDINIYLISVYVEFILKKAYLVWFYVIPENQHFLFSKFSDVYNIVERQSKLLPQVFLLIWLPGKQRLCSLCDSPLRGERKRQQNKDPGAAGYKGVNGNGKKQRL